MANPLERLASMTGEASDVARDHLDAAPSPLETPDQTNRRLITESQQTARLQREAATDYAQRGIPTFKDTTGNIQPVRDGDGAALTHFDKRNNVAYDSTGAPKALRFGETGAPELADPYASAPTTVDPKTGHKYKVAPGLPWKWEGTDPELSAAAAAKERDKAVGGAVQLFGRKLSLEESELTAGERRLKREKEALQQTLPPFSMPEAQAALDAGDVDTALKYTDAHFDELYQGGDANKGMFQREFSAEQVARRAQIDTERAAAHARVRDLAGLSSRLGSLRGTVAQQRAMLSGLVEERAQGALGRLGMEMPQGQQPQGLAAPTDAQQVAPVAAQDLMQQAANGAYTPTPENDQKLAAVAQTPEVRNSFLQEIGRGAVRGWAGSMASLGGLMRMVGMEESGAAVSEYWDGVSQDNAASTDIATFDPASAQWWAARLPEVTTGFIPQIAVALASQGASLPVQLAGFGIMGGGIMAGDTYNEAVEDRMQKGESPEQARDGAIGEAAVVGGIGAALESIPGMAFFSKNPVLHGVLGKVIKNKIAQRGVTGFTAEAFTELGQEIVTDFAALGYRDDAARFKDAYDRWAASFLLGGVMGAGVGIALNHGEQPTVDTPPPADGTDGTAGTPQPVAPGQALAAALGARRSDPSIDRAAQQAFSAIANGADDAAVAEHLTDLGLIRRNTDPLAVAKAFREQSGATRQAQVTEVEPTEGQPVETEVLPPEGQQGPAPAPRADQQPPAGQQGRPAPTEQPVSEEVGGSPREPKQYSKGAQDFTPDVIGAGDRFTGEDGSQMEVTDFDGKTISFTIPGTENSGGTLRFADLKKGMAHGLYVHSKPTRNITPTNEQDQETTVQGQPEVRQDVPQQREVPVVPEQPDASQQKGAPEGTGVTATNEASVDSVQDLVEPVEQSAAPKSTDPDAWHGTSERGARTPEGDYRSPVLANDDAARFIEQAESNGWTVKSRSLFGDDELQVTVTPPAQSESAQAPASAETPAGPTSAPTEQAVTVAKVDEWNNGANRSYKIESEGNAGNLTLSRNEDGTWGVEMVTVAQQGKGLGAKAYTALHKQLAAEGSGLTSGKAGSLSAPAKKLWARLVANGHAEAVEGPDGTTYRMRSGEQDTNKSVSAPKNSSVEAEGLTTNEDAVSPVKQPKTDSENTEEKREVSSTQVTLPADAARSFTEFARSIPDSDVYKPETENERGGYGREMEPHVTALYGLHTQDPAEVQKALKTVGPITARLGKLSLFENDEYDVLKVEVDSSDLRRVNALLRKQPHTNSFPDYTPHLTIAYLKKGHGKKYAGGTQFDGRELRFDSLTFSSAKREKTEVELSGKPEPTGEITEASARAAVDRALAEIESDLGKLGIQTQFTKSETGSGIFFHNGAIKINPAKLAESMRTARANQRLTGIDATPEGFVKSVLFEEVVHAGQWHVSGKDLPGFYSAKPDSFFPEGWQDAVKKSRYDWQTDPDLHWMNKAEFVRMALQKRWTGTISEAFHRLLKDVLGFLDGVAKTASPEFQAHVAEVRKAVEGLKVQKAEAQQAKPKSSPFHQEKMATLIAEEGTTWKIKGNTVSKAGFGHWTPDEVQAMRIRFREAGFANGVFGAGGRELKSSFIVADNNDGLNTLHRALAEKARAEQAVATAKRAEEAEAKTRERLSRIDPSVEKWMAETFSDPNFANASNKADLSDFLTGKTKKFDGLANPKWRDGIEKIGATDGDFINFDKVKAAFIEWSAKAPKAPRAPKPKAQPKAPEGPQPGAEPQSAKEQGKASAATKAKLKSFGDFLSADAPRSIEEIRAELEQNRQALAKLGTRIAGLNERTSAPSTEQTQRERIVQRINELSNALQRLRKGDTLNADAPEVRYDTAIPKAHRATFLEIADDIIADGVSTPQEFAALLDETVGEKARKYVNTLWNMTVGVDEDGKLPRGQQDWTAIYSAKDIAPSAPAAPEPKAPGQDEQSPAAPEDTPRIDEQAIREAIAPRLEEFRRVYEEQPERLRELIGNTIQDQLKDSREWMDWMMRGNIAQNTKALQKITDETTERLSKSAEADWKAKYEADTARARKNLDEFAETRRKAEQEKEESKAREQQANTSAQVRRLITATFGREFTTADSYLRQLTNEAEQADTHREASPISGKPYHPEASKKLATARRKQIEELPAKLEKLKQEIRWTKAPVPEALNLSTAPEDTPVSATESAPAPAQGTEQTSPEAPKDTPESATVPGDLRERFKVSLLPDAEFQDWLEKLNPYENDGFRAYDNRILKERMQANPQMAREMVKLAEAEGTLREKRLLSSLDVPSIAINNSKTAEAALEYVMGFNRQELERLRAEYKEIAKNKSRTKEIKRQLDSTKDKIEREENRIKESQEALARIRAAFPSPTPSATESTTTESSAPVQEQAPEGATLAPISNLATFADFEERLREGTVTAEQVKAAWEQYKAAEPTIRVDLGKLPKDRLIRMNGMHARSSDTKAQLIEGAISSVEATFQSDAALSYGLITGDMKKAKRAAMEKSVQGWTDAKIQKDAEARKERIAARTKALTNPETLEEFQAYVRRQGALNPTPEEKAEAAKLKGSRLLDWIMRRGESKLTPEQRAKYDELRGIDKKTEQKQQEERKAFVPGVRTDVNAEIVPTKHTKTGDDLFVVRLAERVERDVYDRLNAAAKKLGGHYSSYAKNGAIPGFTFKSNEVAEQFLAITKGESVDRSEQVQERREEKKNAAAERLRKIAAGLENKASEVLNKDRKTNTAKRAREAAGAESTARGDQAFAETLRNLADGMERGDVTLLDNIKNRAQVETLNTLARAAFSHRKSKAGSYSEEGRALEARDVLPEDMEHAQYPYPYIDASDIMKMVEAGRNTDGAKLLAERVAKIRMTENGGEATRLRDPRDVENVRELAKKVRNQSDGGKTFWDRIGWKFESYDRLQQLGLTDLPMLRAALREFLQFRKAKAQEDPLKKAERALVGMKIPGFFPTPKALAERMVEEVGIQPGMTVLEPSAGKGDLADAAKDAGAEVDTVERQGSLRELLELRGHRIVGHDFTQLEPNGSYDRIVMNPPFEDGQDIEHVLHAFKFLKPGGKLVAIMSEGPFFRNDKTAREFREWLEAQGGTSEKLPEGSFSGSDAFRQTGTNTRLVVIKKPGTEQASTTEKPYTQELREDLGVGDKAKLDAYDPSQAVTKVGSKWTYRTTDGSDNPLLVETRKEAVSAAEAHKAMKLDQYANPHSYRDIVRVRAGKQLALIRKYMGQGMSEMEAGKKAQQEIPDPDGTSDALSSDAPVLSDLDQSPDPSEVPQTQSAEFREWFAGSKVVDENGQPLVVYHGTREQFTDFSNEFIGDGNGNSDWGEGFYFASNPEAANAYAEGDGGNVMPVYLSIKNPATSDVMLSSKVQDAMDDGMGFESVQEVLEELGYDGIAIDHGKDGMEYIVFEPTQIKSAIGNDGTFDADDANMLSSDAPLPALKIEAVIQRLDPRKGLRWFWEGTADVLDRSGFKALSKAVWKQPQEEAKEKADAWKPQRKALAAHAKLSKKDQAEAMKQWSLYFRNQERAAADRRKGRDEKADRRSAVAKGIYETANAETKALIDAWKETAVLTGQRRIDNNVLVKDGEVFRKMKQMGDRYFPKKLNRKTMKVLGDKEKYPGEWEVMVQDLIENENIKDPSEADKYLREHVFKKETDWDFYSSIETARKADMPESWMEYSWNEIVPWYVTNYARRMGQIKAYGQTTNEKKDLWDQTLADIPKTESTEYTQAYIMAAAEAAKFTRLRTPFANTLRFLQTFATGALLSSPFSAVRNMVSGTTQTAVIFGPAEALKQTWNAVTRKAAKVSAQDLGVIHDDLFAMMTDPQDGRGEDTPMRQMLQKVVGKTLRMTGFTLAEEIVRTTGALSAMNFARKAALAITEDAGSAKSAQYMAVIRRMRSDPLKLVAEHAPGFKGQPTETEHFIRQSVIETQGGYTFGQTPLHMSEPTVSFLTQFQKWGTQMARFLAKHAINPMVHGQVETLYELPSGKLSLDPESGGRPVEKKVRSFQPFIYVVAFAILGGEGLYWLKELLTGRKRPDSSFEEVGKADTDTDKMLLLANRLTSDIIMAGTMGMLTDYAANFKEFSTRGRFKNPLDPPGTQFIKNIYKTAVTGWQQGTLTSRDVLAALASQFPGVAFAERFSKTVAGEDTHVARNDQALARDAGMRAAKALGMPIRAPFGGDMPVKSPNTPFYNELQNALLTGNGAEVRALVNERVKGKPFAEREKMMKGMRSSVSMGAPLRIGGFASAANRLIFLSWAQKNLPAADLKRVKELDRRYWSAAQSAGLADGEPVPREMPSPELFRGFTKR